MTGQSGNGSGRLKGSQLGYLGKGIPDEKTISRLQKRYVEAIEAGALGPEIRDKLKRMRELAVKVEQARQNKAPKDVIKSVIEEADSLALELLPIMHFKADDVDWDK